jgi:hypothetical protein
MKLLLVALSFMSISLFQPTMEKENRSELELICVDVVICLANGECGILEVCAEAEDLEDYARYLGGALGDEISTLKVTGLSSFSNGSSLLIKPGTTFRAKGKRSQLTGRSVVAGKYKVVNGSVSLKLGDKR